MTSAPAAARPRLAFLVTVDWYFVSHYVGLAQAARAAGYDVSVITHLDAHADIIRAAGIEPVALPISRKGMHPLREARSLAALVAVLRRRRPDLVHAIAQKPVLYGAIATRLAGSPALVAALPGLGWLFTADTPRARLGRTAVTLGYRGLLRHPRVRTLVQNAADQAELRRLAGLDAVLIPGAGVDLARFRPTPTPPAPPVTLILAARLLWDKGVGELVAAARTLRERGIDCRCCLVGEPDAGNPASVSEGQLRDWQVEGVIEWWGRRDDMPRVLAGAHIACLPSYREGMPRFLLEAAAAGLPLVATDIPGCRAVVEDGGNGVLVPVRDAGALAEAIGRLATDAGLRERMGRRSREIAEARFDQRDIHARVLAVYADLLGRP